MCMIISDTAPIKGWRNGRGARRLGRASLSTECRYPGLRAAEDQRVNVVRAFVGIDRFEVPHVADHLDIVSNEQRRQILEYQFSLAIVSSASPYRSSFFAPMPDRPRKSSSVRGRVAAIASRVLS